MFFEQNRSEKYHIFFVTQIYTKTGVQHLPVRSIVDIDHLNIIRIYYNAFIKF